MCEKLHIVMSSLVQIDALSLETFMSLLGNAVEHFPSLAAAVWLKRPFESEESLVQAFHKELDGLGESSNIMMQFLRLGKCRDFVGNVTILVHIS